MCGRFTLRSAPNLVSEAFGVPELPLFDQSYNVAPTQTVMAVRMQPDQPAREAVLLRWGLIPSWADDPSIGNRLINARADTVATKPSFRSAFKSRRCLVATDGFFEWQKVGSKKQPWYFQMKDGRPFAFAGLWETWRPREGGDPIETCSLITTDANEVLQPVHDRMPVIIPLEEYDAWLDPSQKDVQRLVPLLRPFAADRMRSYPVGVRVNNPRNNDPSCIKQLTN